MSRRGVSLRGLTAAALLFVACSGCYSTMRKHPQLEERRARIASVAVIPPDVEVIEHAFKGSGKRLREDEDRVRGNLASLTMRVLEDQGLTAKRANLEEPALKEKPELRFKLTQVQEAFTREMGEAYQREMMRRSKAFKAEHSLGPGVNVFAEHAQADGLVFIRMRGFHESKGQRGMDYTLAVALAVATGVYADPGSGEGAVVQVGLVDGATGDVLWCNMRRATDLDGMSMEKAVQRMMKGLASGKKKEEKKERNQSWKTDK